MMENMKVYVEVTAKFDTDGIMMPVSFIWEDGTVSKRYLSCKAALYGSSRQNQRGWEWSVRKGRFRRKGDLDK